MTDLTIGGATFRIEEAGDATKPALILSNALGTDLSMWDGQVAALAESFRVVRYDPRGHGGSSVGDAPVSIEGLGRDVLAILDALEIDKAHVMGLSMGGTVALWLLVNAPDRIGRVVLANTAARISTPEAWNARITSVLGDGMDDVAAALIERWFSADFAKREPERVEAVHATLRRISPQGYARAAAALRDVDLRAALGEIRNEVLVVTGRDDPVVSSDVAAELVEGIDGARHVALAARHLSNIEAEAAFNEAVITFLTAPVRAPAAARSSARKIAPAKRGGSGRRSNAARSPLKKAPAKRAAPKKAARKAAKTSQAHRRPVAKRGTGRRAASQIATNKVATNKATTGKAATKATVKKAAAKKASTAKAAKKAAARKASPARRPTPTAKARGAVAKPKPTKRVTKAVTKKAPAKATKKLPTPRRKAAAKPRRPTGRRKP